MFTDDLCDIRQMAHAKVLQFILHVSQYHLCPPSVKCTDDPGSCARWIPARYPRLPLEVP